MKQKKQKEKGQFFRIGNILWAVKNFWTTDKAFCFFVLIDIPLAILITLAGSYFPKLLIDTMSAGETFEKAAAIIGVYTATMIAMKLLASFSFAQCQGRRYFFANGFQAARAVKHATTDYENLEKQDYKKKYGYAGRDLTNGNASVEMVWGDLQSFFINALGIITLASLMAFLNPLIFAVIIAVSVVSFFLTRWRAKFYEANKDKWEKEERRRGYLERISEDFSRAKDIKLYGMQDWIDGMMRDYQEYVLMWTIRSDRRSLWANIISAVLTLVQDGTAYIFLIGMLFAGELGAGDFVFYFGVVGSVANYLRSVLGNVAALTTRAEKIDYVREYLAIPDTFNHGEGIPLPEHDVKIEFRDVWYRYEGAEDFTLKGVNLTVNKGEKLALVGMNGAGKTLEYRAKSEKLESVSDIRIVEAEGYDRCACCAPHLDRTGKVGLIKIVDAMHYKGGMRFSALCGFDALADYDRRLIEIRKISSLLSAKPHEIALGVEAKLAELVEAKKTIGALRRELTARKLAAIAETADNICIFDDTMDGNAMREFATNGMKKTKSMFAVFSGNDEDGYQFVIASETTPLKAKIADIRTALGGKCGGSDKMLFGHAEKKRDIITAYFI